MSKYTMDKAMAPWEAHYKSIVMHNTWGHLFPKERFYQGKVVIAINMYESQGAVILDEKDLPNASPWWYDAITEFAFEAFKDADTNDGIVYEVDIQVEIVDCIEEISEEDMEGYRQQAEEHKGLSGWTLEEIVPTPDEWQEIHVKELKRTVMVKGY